jgi:hypothetical protein
MGFKENLSRFGLLGEIWAFMRERKKWWLGPILFMMIMLSILIVVTEKSVIAPFIYALF